jgi:hypothetical protein
MRRPGEPVSYTRQPRSFVEAFGWGFVAFLVVCALLVALSIAAAARLV